MHCPLCAGPLGPSRFHAILFQRCFACKASWFLPGQLKAVADAMIADGGIPDDALHVGRAVTGTAGVHEPARACPACRGAMEKLNYGYDSNVMVDHCPRCDAHWAVDAQVRAIAVHTKGNPALDRLGRAFVEESSRQHADGDRVRDVISLANPFTAVPRLPYKTSVPVVRTASVLYALAALNVLVHFLVQPSRPVAAAVFRRVFALTPALVTAGHNYHGFLTSMFLHAGIMHLAGNLYFLWVFGRNVEDALDHFDFLVLYLVTGLTAGLAQVLMDPGSAVPTVGASGAISGVLGAYLRLFPDSKVEVWMGRGRVRMMSARFYLGLWFILQALSMLKNAALGSFSGVAFAAHLGGFAAGWLLTPTPDPAPTSAPVPAAD